MDTQNILVEMKNIHKTFSGVPVLKGVSLKVNKGTVHTLMGENGAGKSTLMKILAGIHSPTKGEIFIGGKTIKFRNPHDALLRGIAMIHQELSPVHELTIGENIYLGREPINPVSRFLDYKEMYRLTRIQLEKLNIDLDPKRKMKDLSVAEMQMVEIAKALSYDSQIIIMDEPTSAISNKEVDKLLEIISFLKLQGKGIIYISHKMEEIFKVSDEITVFRDGNFADTKRVSEWNHNSLVKAMVGREITEVFPINENASTRVENEILKVVNLNDEEKIKNVNFSLKKGEILGITGLVGSGRTEIVEAIFGIRKYTKGDIFIKGKKVKISTPLDAINKEIAFVTEDRKEKGLILSSSILQNISISRLDNFIEMGLIDRKKEKKAVKKVYDFMNVKANSLYQEVATLSGGNQQKVVIGKWLLQSPEILILDEPTRGIDIGAKTEIYKLIVDLSKQGVSIIMISSEMPEILGLSDRILIVHEGKTVKEMPCSEATQENILEYASGKKGEE